MAHICIFISTYGKGSAITSSVSFSAPVPLPNLICGPCPCHQPATAALAHLAPWHQPLKHKQTYKKTHVSHSPHPIGPSDRVTKVSASDLRSRSLKVFEGCRVQLRSPQPNVSQVEGDAWYTNRVNHCHIVRKTGHREPMRSAHTSIWRMAVAVVHGCYKCALDSRGWALQDTSCGS